MAEPHDVLGVPADASRAEIAAAYRVLAHIYHPDRWLDAPPAVQETAARRMRELIDARRQLTRGRRAGAVPGAGATPGGASPRRAPGRAGGQGRSAGEARDRERTRRVASDERFRQDPDVVSGVAVARPRRPRSPRAVHAGLGEALVTNRIPCRGCRSLQELPEGWRDELDEVVYHCSRCDRVLLAHRPRG